MSVLVYLEDWCIAYKDGVKVFEDHSIDAAKALELAGVEYEKRWLDATPFDCAVCETGITPDFLVDVPVSR